MDFELLEQFDRFAKLRNTLAFMGRIEEHWAGIPMPLDDLPLVVHPRYPFARELMGTPDADPDVGPAEVNIRNRFWSNRLRSTLVMYEKRGKIRIGIDPGANHVTEMLNTLGASDAWGIEQEHHALTLLGTLVAHHTFKHYLMTGMFLESSPRSGVFYLFRKLRPTIAIKERKGRMVILAALCMHPIAHYAGSWGGAMCPTDDVIAALMLMRGDEHMFWKRSNQHPPSHPQAGV